MYMLQECRRILQLVDQIVVEAPKVELDDTRALEALAFSAMPPANTGAQPALSSAASNAEPSATSSVADSVGGPGSPQPEIDAAQLVDCASEGDDASAGEAAEDGDNMAEEVENCAAQLVDCASEGEDASAGEAAEDVDNMAEELENCAAPGEAAEDVDDMAEELEITALRNTTNVHDDWLHRGPFLVDLDLPTYIAHIIRIPRPDVLLHRLTTVLHNLSS